MPTVARQHHLTRCAWLQSALAWQLVLTYGAPESCVQPLASLLVNLLMYSPWPAQESTADAPTVAWSYAAMLVYVTVALSALPKGAAPAALLVHSRASLALGGVSLVACAVVGALGATCLHALSVV